MEKNVIKSKSIHTIQEHFVYGIYDRSELVYIGYTKDVNKRYADHIRFSTNKLLNQLVHKCEYSLDMRVIAVFYDITLAKEYESILINRYKETLYNLKDEAYRLPIK